jgi:hypothetical protein
MPHSRSKYEEVRRAHLRTFDERDHPGREGLPLCPQRIVDITVCLEPAGHAYHRATRVFTGADFVEDSHNVFRVDVMQYIRKMLWSQ